MSAPTFADVRAAADRIRPFVRRTPVLTSSTLDRLAGRNLFLKCEPFQTTGSFKYRGATNAVQKLGAASAARGVVTHSSGNHGQALARAAQVRGIPAHVVMPVTASNVKREAVRGYGGTVVDSGPTTPEREAKVAEVQAATGAVLIPPFDHADVMAGQGTAALELLEDVPDLDAVIAPIGGGGLISGFCLAANGVNPAVRVFAAEPVGSSAGAQSLAAGERVRLARTASVADGLLANYVGVLPWEVIRARLERAFTVEEAEIVAAMRLLWERLKVVVEPSGAVATAALLGDEFRGAVPEVRRVGVILSGGNVDLGKLPW